MLSVNSARQLYKMFFSLHVVFLSVAIVESSAANPNPKGKIIRALWTIFCIAHVICYKSCTVICVVLTCPVVVILRLREIQRCGVQGGTAELLLGSDLFKLDQHH